MKAKAEEPGLEVPPHSQAPPPTPELSGMWGSPSGDLGKPLAVLCCAAASSAVKRRWWCPPPAPGEGGWRAGQPWKAPGAELAGRAGRAFPCLCPSVIHPPVAIAGADLPEAARWLWSPPGPPETMTDVPGPRAFSACAALPCTQPLKLFL